jgi:hypothetical protein
MKKFLLLPFILFTFILGGSLFSQNTKALTLNPNCSYDNNDQVMCPQWDPAPNFCLGGTIQAGELNECGCSGAPVCITSSPAPSSTPVACTEDARLCSDGSSVGRIGPNCEFAPCPSTRPVACTEDARRCPDGSSVGRIGPNCEFAPCPSTRPTPTPPSGCTYRAVQCIQAPCPPIIICPSPTPQQYCQSDTDCSNGEYCYQPPMPYCPPGAACIQAFPQRYCKEKETITNNKVSFATPYAKLSADNFYIETNGKKFLAQDTNIRISSDPGSDIYTTLEITWNEHSVPMRMYIYFKYTPGGFWEVTELRTYDGTSNYRQLYYPGFTGHELGNELVMSVFDLNSKDGRGKVHFENLHLQAFLDIEHKPPSEFGYYIEKKPVENIEVTLSGPSYGYGVNAILRDSNDQVVNDQSQFNYVWTSLDTTILTVSPQSICLYGVSLPCPMSNAQMSFHKIGTTKVKVQVMNASNQEVASEEFTFVVKQKSADLNRDGKVNLMDYSILTSQFMRTDYPISDINADGKVNLMDFTIMMGEFNPNFALP